jgi:hypothetical protein
LRWDTFPVTVLDRNRQIASGGILSSVNEEWTNAYVNQDEMRQVGR